MGENSGFSVNASGTGLNYQWKHNNSPLTEGGSYSGTQTSTLSVNPIIFANQGIYNCEITGTCDVSNTDPATLVVSENINISTHPVPITVCELDNAIFNIEATGTNLRYQWQKNGIDIPGATSSEFTIAGAQISDQGTYRCVVSGNCGSFNSNGAGLTVNTTTGITVQPLPSVMICQGSNLNLSVTATGNALSYQWQRNGFNLVNGGNISGAMSSNLFITGVTLADDGGYTCLVTGSCGNEVSILSDVTIQPITVINQQPNQQLAFFSRP